MTEPCKLLKRPAPAWASAESPTIPVAYDYDPAGKHQHNFRLGDSERCVTIQLGEHWKAQPIILVSYAAKAWHELVGEECDHDTAELIAKGWIKAAAAATPMLERSRASVH